MTNPMSVEVTLDKLKRLRANLESGNSMAAGDVRLMLAVIAVTIKEFEDPAFSLGSELSKAALSGERILTVKVKKAD